MNLELVCDRAHSQGDGQLEGKQLNFNQTTLELSCLEMKSLTHFQEIGAHPCTCLWNLILEATINWVGKI